MSQKVIQVSAHHGLKTGHPINEVEFPELNKYLDEGYQIVNTIPFGQESYEITTIVFILNKPTKSRVSVL